MQAKKPESKPPISQRSVVIVPTEINNVGGGEETEVAAQITVPAESGWAWVVLTASFFMVGIIDSFTFTYGSLIKDISDSFKVDMSVAASVNAVQTAVYFMSSPIASALINRFGFRTVAMMGSLICSLGLLITFYTSNIISLIFSLSFMTGVGDALVNMSASLIVGFYFEKRRALATAITTGGSSVGVMCMYPINSKLVNLAGWKSCVLLFSGLHGIIYFLSLTFRPLLALTVTQTEEESGNLTRAVIYLPAKSSEEASKKKSVLGTVSNMYFPTAQSIFKDGVAMNTQAGTSTGSKPLGISKITLQAQGTVSKKQLEQIQSIVSKANVTKGVQRTEITIEAQERKKKKSFFARCCDWESDLEEARPMYRDDVLYEGDVKKLPVYKQSVAAIKEEERTGLEYHLAVSRAITVNDLQERRGVCTIAVRRVLATMLDPVLLKKKSFLCFSVSGLACYSGLLVPFVYIQDRNLQKGVDADHCALFVSVISFANLLARFLFSTLASKIDPINLYIAGLTLGGICTILSDLSYSLPYQYGYCFLFGGTVSVVSGLRSVVIVSLYGLDHLTNATGIVLMFIGVGTIYATPLAGFLKTKFGYQIAFYVSGVFVSLSGIIGILTKIFSKNENIRQPKK